MLFFSGSIFNAIGQLLFVLLKISFSGQPVLIASSTKGPMLSFQRFPLRKQTTKNPEEVVRV